MIIIINNYLEALEQSDVADVLYKRKIGVRTNVAQGILLSAYFRKPPSLYNKFHVIAHASKAMDELERLQAERAGYGQRSTLFYDQVA